MFYVSLIFFVIIFIMVSYILGLFITQNSENKTMCIFTNSIYGLMIIFTVFQLIAVPSILMLFEFTVFYYTALVVYTILTVAALLFYGKDIGSTLLRMTRKKYKIRENYYLAIVILMLVSIVTMIIVGYLRFSASADADDAFFVATATTTLASNSMYRVDPFTGIPYYEGVFTWRYVLSPLPIFWAFLSQLFGVHPAIMSRIFFPIVLLFFLIGTYFMIGSLLFKRKKNHIASFLLLALITVIYSGTRDIDEGTWFLLVMHHGRVFIWLAYIPLCFYFVFRIIDGEQKGESYFCLILLSLGSGLLSSMSIALIPLCIGILGLAAFVYHRRVKDTLITILCSFPVLVFGVIFIISTRL